MKKIYYFITLFLFSGFIGKSQCVLDSTNVQPGFSPVDSTLPVINPGNAYDASAQFYFPPFFINTADSTDTLVIRYITIDSTVTGIPTGIAAHVNPSGGTVGGNGRGCIEFVGTTNGPARVYPLGFQGSARVTNAVLDTTFTTLAGLDSLLELYGYDSIMMYALFVQYPYIRPCTNNSDTSMLTTPGAYPVASDLPCIVQGEPYNQTVEGMIQTDSTVSVNVVITTLTFLVTVDSVIIDSIQGLPTGITFGRSPEFLHPMEYGCINFAGTTTDTTGTYPLTAYGTAWLTPSGYGRTLPTQTINGNLNSYSPFGAYYLRVIAPGDSCSLTVPSGIHDFNKTLDAEVSVFPNPSNGVFNLKISSQGPVTGQVWVTDAVGRNVYEQAIDFSGFYNGTIDLGRFASGIYSLQVRTPNGIAVKKISLQ